MSPDLPPSESQLPIDSPPIDKLTLDQFLKREGWTGTGGQAKYVIQEGMVLVNGAVETRRRKQLSPGDIIEFQGQRGVVQ